MKTIYTLAGVDIEPSAGLPSVQRSPAGEAMAHPAMKWAAFMDPADVVGGRLRQKAVSGQLTINNSVAQTQDSFSNGAPALFFNQNKPVNPLVAFSKEAWTIFWVVEPDSGFAAQLVRALTDDPSGLSPRMSFSNTGSVFAVYQGSSTTTRVAWGPGGAGFLGEGRFYIMVTWSATAGMRLYVDGVLRDEETGETDPFDSGDGVGEFQMFNVLRGRLGMSGILHEDLSLPSMKHHRERMDAFIMEKYGL